MRDRDVRFALRHKVLAEHIRDTQTLVIEELGLSHGAARVDIAVVNGTLHGYEIKSDADTLRRLPAQVDAYGSVLDKVTIVAGGRHAEAIEGVIPAWWGVKVATVGPRGAIHFREIRPARQNSNISPFALAGLFWRDEAIRVLTRHGVRRVLSKSRHQLCELLACKLPLDTLRDEVRAALKLREGWRSDAQRVSGVGSLLPSST